MTAIRQSFVYRPEKEFNVPNEDYGWIAPPPGTFADFTHSRQASALYATGSKDWETAAYGALQGSWNWSFTFDYDYLEPFLLCFENYAYNEATGTHSFKKVNNARIPSFSMRFTRLNGMTGSGGKDEIVELTGCVVKQVKFSCAGGSSQISVAMSGMYANESMILQMLSSTDYTPYDGDLVEFACLTIGDEYIATTESLSVSIDNSAEFIYPTCTPFAVQYAEGQTAYSFSTTAYSDDPEKWRTRLYSGGMDNTHTSPMSKNMGPVPEMSIRSFNSELGEGGIAEAMTKADKSVTFTMSDAILKSLQWQRGDGSKIMDSLSSVSCRRIEMSIKNSALKDVSKINHHEATLAIASVSMEE